MIWYRNCKSVSSGRIPIHPSKRLNANIWAIVLGMKSPRGKEFLTMPRIRSVDVHTIQSIAKIWICRVWTSLSVRHMYVFLSFSIISHQIVKVPSVAKLVHIHLTRWIEDWLECEPDKDGRTIYGATYLPKWAENDKFSGRDEVPSLSKTELAQ